MQSHVLLQKGEGDVKRSRGRFQGDRGEDRTEQPRAKDRSRPPEAGRGKARILPQSLRRPGGPTDVQFPPSDPDFRFLASGTVMRQ